MSFHISMKHPERRRKGLAVSAAQAVFKLGFKHGDFHNAEDVASVLRGREDVVNTPYGKVKCDELASLISREGLDMNEFSARLIMYEAKRLRARRRMEREMRENLADFVSDLIDARSVSSVEEIISKISEVEIVPTVVFLRAGGGTFTIDREGAVAALRGLEDKEGFVELVNRKLERKHRNFMLAMELEEYLNEVGRNFNVKSSVIELEEFAKGLYGIKVEIDGDVYLDWFEGSFEELKEALSNIVLEKGSRKRGRRSGSPARSRF